MDLSLSKGRLPEDGDFPASLRGLFTAGFSPLRMLLGGGPIGSSDSDVEVMRFFESGLLQITLQGFEPGTVSLIPSDEDTVSPGSSREGGLAETESPADMLSRSMGSGTDTSPGEVEMREAPPPEGI